MPRIAMKPVGAFGYEAEVPTEVMSEGLLEYAVSVYEGEAIHTFPGDQTGHPHQWDFAGQERWRVPVVPENASLLLFDAARDLDHVLYPHPWGYVSFRTGIVSGSEPERLGLSAVVEDFSPAPHHFALRTFLPEGQRTRLGDAPTSGGVLRVRARATGRAADRMRVALVERDGTAWGAVIELTEAWQEIEIPLSELRPTPLALLPRPYPQFLPYLVESEPGRDGPRVAEDDGLQFTVSRGLFGEADAEGEHGFLVERVVLEPGP
jgi:hypothetical protein